MRNATLIHVGDFRESEFVSLENEYIKRMTPYCNYRTVCIREENTFGEESEKLIAKALSREAEAIRKHIPPGSKSIALCIEGRELDSIGFASLVAGIESDICFIIGSSFGLDEALKAECDMRISMSKMTFPHRLARIMLAEQLYRALSINANRRYHK